jgi:hypothetical protein
MDLHRIESTKSLLLLSVALFLAGVLNDPPWKWYSTTQSVAFLGEPAHVVHSLLLGDGFANPYSPLKTGVTAHVAPAFPFLQFVLLRVFGTGATGWLALRWLATVALSLQFALLPWLARALGFSVLTGVLAAVLGLIEKPGKEELWEAHLVGITCILITFLFSRRSARTKLHMFVLGSLAGAALLLQPVTGLVYYGALCFSRLPLRQLLMVVALPVLICVPWLARNYYQLGSFNLRDNLGLELYVSFNDCAPYGTRASERISCYTSRHPNASLSEAQEVHRLGEYEYNRNRFSLASDWISRHSRQAAFLVLQRFWFFWFPSDEGVEGYKLQRWRMVFSHFVTLASLLGIILSFRGSKFQASLLLIWLAVYPVIYYVLEFETRYRYPIAWCTWLFAASCVEWTKRSSLDPRLSFRPGAESKI